MVAKIKTTFATLVYATAKTKAGVVDPMRMIYKTPGKPDLNIGLKAEIPLEINKAARIRLPATAPRQKAMIIGSLSINLTKRESGTTNSTPNAVMIKPFLRLLILCSTFPRSAYLNFSYEKNNENSQKNLFKSSHR